jgi:glycosyltransferase involved in cell wall biosynthesis
MKKKILFLAHTQSIHTIKWVSHFVNANWQVFCISFNESKIDGTTHYAFNPGKINTKGSNYQYLFYLPKIIRLVFKIRPSIICSHFLTSFGLLGYLTNYRPHVVALHGTDVFVNTAKHKLYYLLGKRILKTSAHIFSVSDAMTNYIKRNLGVNHSKITTIQYGINLDLFKLEKGIENRKIQFTTNRLFVPNSNYHFMLSVMSNLKKRGYTFILSIIGSGPLRSDIEKEIEDLGLKESVTIENRIPQEEMALRLQNTLFYLSFTTSDGTPLSVFEAAACGAYPILSNNQSNVEWTTKGIIGTIIDLEKVDETTETIINLMNNIPNNNYQKNNLDFIQENMNYKKNMKTIEEEMLKYAM